MALRPLAIMLLAATTANAASYFTVENSSSDLSIKLPDQTLANGEQFTAFFKNDQMSFTIGEKTVLITDSHEPCLRGFFNSPFAWYMDISVDNKPVGRLCTQYNGLGTSAEGDVTLADTDALPNGHVLTFMNLGYFSQYKNYSNVSYKPVTYIW